MANRLPFCLASSPGTRAEIPDMRVVDLNDGWEFRRSKIDPYYRPCVLHPEWLPAQVPGCVHLDLMATGQIADPFVQLHEHGCQWIDETDWEYRLSFSASNFLPGSPNTNTKTRSILRFEGLDTCARIYLNGQLIAQADNFFLPIEVDVSEKLFPESNLLEIHFRSAVLEGMARRNEYFQSAELGPQTTFFDERAFVRKPQYMSGWDWGPRLVSCGIWKPVRLIQFRERIWDFRVHQEWVDERRVRVWSETSLEALDLNQAKDRLKTTFDGQEFAGEFELILDSPKIWEPNGLGVQHLYTATATLGEHTLTKRIGLRRIELRREPDEWGESFQFWVNGKPIFAIGGNWIPNDSFPSRIDPSQVRKQLQDCAELGMKMIRVWGGGLYESDAFYDACDELGLLVWQDFPFACSYYPDDPGFLEQFVQEAQYHVKRLRDRACLALWCGNNEIQTMWESRWGKPEDQPNRFHGEEIFRTAIPRVLAELDPSRSYIETSPTGSDPSKAPNCNGDNFGDQHYWDVWHGKGDWTNYDSSGARFCSEFGFASSCSLECWRLALSDADSASPQHPAIRSHDKTNKPWDLFRSMVELHQPRAESLSEWVRTSQLNQRDAMRQAVEHFRISPKCAGALVWQLNDCWPAQSWSLQDYARQWKPAGQEMKRLCHPVLVAVRSEPDRLLVAVDSWLDIPEIEVLLEFCLTEEGEAIHQKRIGFTQKEMKRGEWKEIPGDSESESARWVRASWTQDRATSSTRKLAPPN